MREKIRTRQYILTIHAEDEMENDQLTIFDIEHCILTGQIVERQKDIDSGEWKYIIRGKCFGFKQDMIIVVGKISITNKLVVQTVFLE